MGELKEFEIQMWWTEMKKNITESLTCSEDKNTWWSTKKVTH